MAIDRWLLHQHQQGQLPPVLRFYTWQPAAISLGYHQRRWPSAWQSLMWQGQAVELVRRPSGGRAVLHGDDLTYALICSGLSGSRLQVYQQLCQFLMEGFKALGVPLTLGAAGRGYIHNPSCFATATGADLVLAQNPQQKFIGSAQLWSDGALLQHGSIRLRGEGALYQQAFGEAGQPCPLPLELSELPEPLLQQRVIEALVAAAERCFAAQFETVPLSAAEIEAAKDAFAIAL